jgi:hypothetical protein
MEFVGPPVGVKGCTLHCTVSDPDASRVKIVDHRLCHRRETGNRGEQTGIDAVGVTGLGEQLFCLLRIVWKRLDLQGERHDTRDDDAGRRAEAEAGCLIDPFAVDRISDSEPQALVMPGRFWVVLVGKLDPLGRCMLARHDPGFGLVHQDLGGDAL